MNEDDHKGIASILNLPHRSPVKTPKVETQEFPSLSLSETVMRLKPLELPKSETPVVSKNKNKMSYQDEYNTYFNKKHPKYYNNQKPKLANLPIVNQKIGNKKIGALNYINKVKENYNDPGSERFVNETLNKFENGTDNKDVVTFNPTTQLFTDNTRTIAFKSYDQAKRWNDAVNGQPTAKGQQVNDLKARLDNAREFGHNPDKKDNRKQEMKTQTNKHRRLI